MKRERERERERERAEPPLSLLSVGIEACMGPNGSQDVGDLSCNACRIYLRRVITGRLGYIPGADLGRPIMFAPPCVNAK